jgi:hypothetical protein
VGSGGGCCCWWWWEVVVPLIVMMVVEGRCACVRGCVDNGQTASCEVPGIHLRGSPEETTSPRPLLRGATRCPSVRAAAPWTQGLPGWRVTCCETRAVSVSTEGSHPPFRTRRTRARCLGGAMGCACRCLPWTWLSRLGCTCGISDHCWSAAHPNCICRACLGWPRVRRTWRSRWSTLD